MTLLSAVHNNVNASKFDKVKDEVKGMTRKAFINLLGRLLLLGFGLLTAGLWLSIGGWFKPEFIIGVMAVSFFALIWPAALVLLVMRVLKPRRRPEPVAANPLDGRLDQIFLEDRLNQILHPLKLLTAA